MTRPGNGTPDILLLLCDTARADAFSPWRASAQTPIMQRLSQEGIWYERAIAPAPWTLPSTTSIFTGRLPTEHGITGEVIARRGRRLSSPAHAIRDLKDSWLPERLRERSYRTMAVSCNPWVSRWGGFDRGFDQFVDINPLKNRSTPRAVRRLQRLVDLGRGDKGGIESLRRVRAFLTDEPGPPRFAFVNLMEMHAPYVPPKRFHPAPLSILDPLRSMRTFSYQLRQRRLNDGANRPFEPIVRSLYFGAGRYEDWLVGQFLGPLRSSVRPIVVVVVGDHGESLGEKGVFGHHSSLHESVLHVPLLLWSQGVDIGKGHRGEPVSLLGLSSWLLSQADGKGGELPSETFVLSEYESTMHHRGFGVSLGSTSKGLSGPQALTQEAGLSIRKEGLKYVATESGEEAIYDLEVDPAEEQDVLGDRQGLVPEFRTEADAWRRRRGAQVVSSDGLSEMAEEEIVEQLRALGYIE
ncbi:MAG: sulfatase-like hydrolase/transferase [Actinomycetota bacterium]|nr:sulfatase-like hydrolase/transferase [Actinomycetota bacterium]